MDNPVVLGLVSVVLLAALVAIITRLGNKGPSKAGTKQIAVRQGFYAQWNETLRAVGKPLGMELDRSSKMWGARGSWSGLDVKLSATVGNRKMHLIVKLTDCKSLCIDRSGEVGEVNAKPTPTGDAELDEAVDVYGASAAQQRAFAEPDLRALMKRVVQELGASVAGNRLALHCPAPQDSTELRAVLTELLRFGRWLNEPLAGASHHAVIRLEAMEKSASKLVRRIGEAIAAGELVQDRDNDRVEWRTEVDGMPLRVLTHYDDIALEIRTQLPVPSLELYWDPAALEEAKKNVWDDDEQPVFVGPGATISQAMELGKHGNNIVEQRIAVWQRLPGALQKRIVEAMRQGDVHELVIETSGLRASLRHGVGELLSPEERMKRLADALSAIVKELKPMRELASSAAGTATAGANAAPLNREVCAYCDAVFVWRDEAVCSNCGAPVSG